MSAKQLVLSGNLLAHPRVKSLLGWEAIPLRAAVDQGVAGGQPAETIHAKLGFLIGIHECPRQTTGPQGRIDTR